MLCHAMLRYATLCYASKFRDGSTIRVSCGDPTEESGGNVAHTRQPPHPLRSRDARSRATPCDAPTHPPATLQGAEHRGAAHSRQVAQERTPDTQQGAAPHSNVPRDAANPSHRPCHHVTSRHLTQAKSRELLNFEESPQPQRPPSRGAAAARRGGGGGAGPAYVVSGLQGTFARLNGAYYPDADAQQDEGWSRAHRQRGSDGTLEYFAGNGARAPAAAPRPP
jgi:hypothetical protein